MKLSPRFFLQTILLAVRQIRAQLRSFLTTLGIMIGVASVSTVIAALTGLKEQVLSEFESFERAKCHLSRSAGSGRTKSLPLREIKLKERELDGLVENCPSFEQFTPNTDFRATVIHGRKEVPNINVVGIWPSWHDIENRPVIMGRPFVEADEIDAKPVAIVNDDAIAELELQSCGLHHHGQRPALLIVGVIETNRTGMMSFQPEQTEIWVPFSTARRMQSPGLFSTSPAKSNPQNWWTRPPQKFATSCGRCGNWVPTTLTRSALRPSINIEQFGNWPPGSPRLRRESWPSVCWWVVLAS